MVGYVPAQLGIVLHRQTPSRVTSPPNVTTTLSGVLSALRARGATA